MDSKDADEVCRVLAMGPSSKPTINRNPVIRMVVKDLGWTALDVPKQVAEERAKLYEEKLQEALVEVEDTPELVSSAPVGMVCQGDAPPELSREERAVKIAERAARSFTLPPLPQVPFNIAWIDKPTKEFLSVVKSGQCVNHFLGISELNSKGKMAKLLKVMQRRARGQYDIFPETWNLPFDMLSFQREFPVESEEQPLPPKSDDEKSGNGQVDDAPGPKNGLSTSISYGKSTDFYVIKRSGQSRGNGIWVVNSLSDVPQETSLIAQRVINNPCVVDGRKFDLRLYVLITSANPLRVYLYKDGLARFCAEKFEPLTDANKDKPFIFLTNYSVNKKSDAYQQNSSADADSSGSKWSVGAIMEHLRSQGVDTDVVWKDICDVVLKTVIAVQPKLEHSYRVAFPNDSDGGKCFEFLGVDVLLDDSYRPWLLEVNRNCSLNVDTPLDKKIKGSALSSCLRMIKPIAVSTPKQTFASLSSSSSSPTSAAEQHRKLMAEQRKRRLQARAARVAQELAVCADSDWSLLFPLPGIPEDVSNAMRKHVSASVYKRSSKAPDLSQFGANAKDDSVKRQYYYTQLLHAASSSTKIRHFVKL